MAQLLRGLVDLLAPPACAACARATPGDRPLCAGCDAALPRIPRERCTRCQEASAIEPGGACLGCATRRSPLLACVAAAALRGGVETWVHRFKYPQPGIAGLDSAARAVLQQLVVEAAALVPEPPPDVLVPVPLHPRRLRARGFNPAALLAGALARELGAPVDTESLERVRDTPTQTALDRTRRRRNLAGAFRVRPRGRLARRVWLVDDVVTTGSTLGEAARTLRRAGVRSVAGVAAARTPASR